MSNMPWLPKKPENFRELLRALPASEHLGRDIQSLASHELDDSSAASLARQIVKLRNSGKSLAPLSPFKLGVLSSATFDLIGDILPAAAARFGVDLEVVLAPFDQIVQQALQPDSLINTSNCDAVLLVVDHRWLQLDRPALAEGSADSRVNSAFQRIKTVADGLRKCGAPTILPILATPADYLFGHMDRRLAGTPRSMIKRFNDLVLDYAGSAGHYVLDVDSIAQQVGVSNWFSAIAWNLYKVPFAPEFGPLFADSIGRVVGAIRGKSRKCLVLDLDNTLWGGVVGDDGVENLKIGQGSAEGEAHLAVQQLALDLSARGIVLAVCSKNFDETARRPFRELPDMLVKEKDIAVFQANWIDKASNLEAIAQKLNLGIDSLVLLDDNPAERAQTRAALPMVAVPELPADPSLFAGYLAASGLFEAVNFSAEDLSRAGSYAAEAQRAEVLASVRNLGDYLSALEMSMHCTSFDSVGRQRIAQLINKSNQFNLTTRRYTEAEVEALETDKSVFTGQFRLSDRFGDFGMIGVVICRNVKHGGEPAWDIDTWLMSCRVLGRRVEEAMLQQIVSSAAQRGIRILLGRYIPTSKNGMVAEHYPKLGFKLSSESSSEIVWQFDVRSYRSVDLPMLVTPDFPQGISTEADTSISLSD